MRIFSAPAPKVRRVTYRPLNSMLGSAPAKNSRASGERQTAAPGDLFLSRELGLLEFNRRVLEQARDNEVPLLERLRFLCIVSNNLDEFFEIRVSGVKEQLKATNASSLLIDGIPVKQLFREVSDRAHALVDEQYVLLNRVLLPELATQNIRFIRRNHWSTTQAQWIESYFYRELMPVLTPIGLDPAHPFPRVLNKSLNFAVELDGRDAFGRKSGAAIVQAPRALPRVIRLPLEIAGCEYGFVFLSSILHAHVGALFSGMTVRGCYQFRVTRNSDLFVDDEEVKNLRLALQGELSHRHFGNAVRLEVADNCSPEMTNFLLGQFELGIADLYQVQGPVNLVRLLNVPDWVDRSDLKFPPFVPGLPAELIKEDDLFKLVRSRDVLLHHPFQSFGPVIELISQAARDPDVLAIKQTVYRTSADSELMEALIDAARSGKEVTVVVELLARFDEEANINWASRLEEAGAHVVFGVVGHKTHAKMLLVVRREEDKLRRYAHLATGNYHPRTAKFYTDFGLFTTNEALCSDVADVFAQLTGLGKASKLKHMWQSPFTLHRELLKAIRRETTIAHAGGRAVIRAKMNALIEPEIIHALYDASAAGVRIELIVRGVCTLRPGLPGISENIRVRSIIGRFLEHSRIFMFLAGGENYVYLSSADWMNRNFFRRIETCFPVLDPQLKKRVIREGLAVYWQDNEQAWEMNADGNYAKRARRRAKPLCAQRFLLGQLAAPETPL